MSRDFGLVKSSLWGSSKFARLSNDTSRLAYIYLHANQHGNAIGVYRLPVEYVAADLARKDMAVAETALADLCSVDLIEYDKAEMVVRILKWFDHNPIGNPKHLIGAVRAFQRLPSMTSFLPGVAADIIASAWQQSRSLFDAGAERKRSENAKSREYGAKNIESATEMVEHMIVLKDHICGSDEAAATFSAAIQAMPSKVSIPLSEGLGIPLSIHKRQETRNSNSDSDNIQQTVILPVLTTDQLIKDLQYRSRAGGNG